MTNPSAMVRDSATLLPVIVGIAWVVIGPMGGVGALASGLVSIVNLWVLGRLVRKLARAVEHGEGGGAVAALLLPKFGLLLGAYALLLWLLDPLAVALGLVVVPAGVTVGGLVRAVLDADSDEAVES